MDILISIAAFLVLIGIVVTIHEGGHFVVGRLCGMKMLEFSIGFGRKIYEKRFGQDQTLFTLRLLPLGGFVKPLDKSMMSAEEWDNLSQEDKNRSFNLAPRWKKALMVAGGPFSNFILAFIVFIIAMCFVGTRGAAPVIAEIVPQSVAAQSGMSIGEKILYINGQKTQLIDDAFPALMNSIIKGEKVNIITDRKSYLIDYTNADANKVSHDVGQVMGFYFLGTQGDLLLKSVDANSAGEEAGLKPGDIIKSFNGQPVHDINKIIRLIQKHPEQKVVFLLERNHEEKTIVVVPHAVKENGDTIGKVGVLFQIINAKTEPLTRYGLGESIKKSFNKVTDSSYTTLISVKKLITGEISTKAISGPLAIADYSGKSAQRGLYEYLLMIASISIAIGVFNLLPIPALDGGHLAQYLIETVIRHEISPKILYRGQMIGFSILASIFFMSLINDISRWFI